MARAKFSGDRLRQFIRQAGYLHREIAEALKVRPGAVSGWLSGANEPRLPRVRELATLLHRDLQDFYGPEEVSPSPIASSAQARKDHAKSMATSKPQKPEPQGPAKAEENQKQAEVARTSANHLTLVERLHSRVASLAIPPEFPLDRIERLLNEFEAFIDIERTDEDSLPDLQTVSRWIQSLSTVHARKVLGWATQWRDALLESYNLRAQHKAPKKSRKAGGGGAPRRD